MKKILIAAIMLSFLLTGCAHSLPDERLPKRTAETKTSETAQAETLSPEEQTLVDRAAEALWEAYDLPDRRHFRPSVYDYESAGTVEVMLRLCIGGYPTGERYTARFSADGELLSTGAVNEGIFLPYLEALTPADLAAAEAALADFLAPYDDYKGGASLTIDDEGCLCLSGEFIVEPDPPPLSGLFSEGGCGIDHDHKFFNHRICPAP